ncbi:MAG: protein jag [Clostridia bacterium]|nr:protein jag [Clostridia bacterium]
MKRELIVTAKSVEEARKKAAAELGLREEEMTVTVLEEGKRGFLGIGAADAKIAVGYEAKDETVGVDAALNFIRQVAENMGLENLTYETKAGTNDDVILAVDGDNAGLLIGHHGETLDALQYLSNLAANKRVNGEKHEYVKITLDVENYREKREAALRALARRKAEKVLREKRSVMLEPMNPYERRIIHSEVQGIEGVSTNSIGVDSNRRVVIFLEGESVEDEEI